MIRILAVVACVIGATIAQDYYGAKAGELCATGQCPHQLRGTVYVVNATHVQIVGLNVAPQGKPDLRFQFSDGQDAKEAPAWYQLQSGAGGDWLQAKSGNLDAGFSNARVVVAVPGGNVERWKNFGVITNAEWKYIGAVSLSAVKPPSPIVLKDASGQQAKLKGQWYEVAASKVEVLNAKTLRLYDFSFLGSKPPDGWLFAGKGRVSKDTGKKAMIVGRDTKAQQCPIKEDMKSVVLTVELLDDQTVYNIDYLSVYCYEVGVNFGHMEVSLNPAVDVVPPYLPPVLASAPSVGLAQRKAC
jgi:hypothetical protein